MYNPKISIIVPVYNVELFLERCLLSIINQTYKNLEVIIIDDGTKDNSGIIADKFSLLDDRIRVIHKKNGGVSSARNVGLKIAKGEYIVFIDSDDYLEKDYIEYYVSILAKTDADVICGLNHFTVWNKKQVKTEEFYSMSNISAMTYIYLEKINVAVWNKIYSKKLIENNKLLFDENIWYGEGMLFNIEVLQNAQNVIVSNKKVYYQTFNPNSAMRDFNLESNLCGLKCLDIQKSKWICEDIEVLNAWKYHKWYFYFSILKGLVKTRTVNENKNLYNQCKQQLKRGYYIPFKVNISKKRKFIDIIISICPIFAAKIFIIKDKIACRRIKYNY